MKRQTEIHPARFLKWKGTVALLNDGPKANAQMLTDADHQRLLRLVRAWKESGSDLRKMKVAPADIPFGSRDLLSAMQQLYEWNVTWDGVRLCIAGLRPGKNHDAALWYFVRLLLSSECEYLGGPCTKCGRYYVKQSLRKDREFCSHKCASHATQSRINKKLHDEKLDAARSAIKNYRSRPKKYADMGWKEWVELATEDEFPQEPITPKFLTRAVNNGELLPPTAR
jgi:hypothetical protein